MNVSKVRSGNDQNNVIKCHFEKCQINIRPVLLENNEWAASQHVSSYYLSKGNFISDMESAMHSLVWHSAIYISWDYE